MLLTICPNCAAQFKVQPEQLNVRQGRVMCGRCRQVFNAFQSLSRVEEPIESPATGLYEAVAETETGDSPPPAPNTSAPFSATDTTPEPVADSLFLREEPLPLPAAFSASESSPRTYVSPEGTRDEPAWSSKDAVTPDTPDTEAPPPAPHQALDAARLEPAIDLSDEANPLLLDAPASRVAPTAAGSRAWSVGAIVLFAGVAAQASYAFRTEIVSNYPQLRPAASRFCELAGCSLSWGRDETALKIEASELIESPGKPGRILLTAILVNRGKTKQDLPSLELRLTDNANQIVVSRLLHPGDYLGRAVAKDEGLVPNTELYVNLNLEVSNKTLASGYGLIVFYP